MKDGSLLLGTGKVDITPSWPVPLAGFAFRDGPSEAIGEPLNLRAFAFADDGEPERCAVLCCADLLWWGPDLVALLRRAAGRAFPGVELVLHASHTHSAPQTSRRFFPELGVADERYLTFLVERAVRGIGHALASMQPVTVRRFEGASDIAVNRRGRRPDGRTPEWPTPDPAGTADRDLTVLRFDRADGRVVALLVHYACHPVVNGSMRVSADFAGAGMRKLEEAYGSGTVAGYLQGAAGDVNPDAVDGGEFVLGDSGEVEVMGDRFAAAVRAALRARPVPSAAGAVGVHRSAVDLPLRQAPTPSALEQLARASGADGSWARFLLADRSRIVDRITLHLVRLDLGEGLTLVGMDAEPVTSYGLLVKRRSAGHALLLGYTDGMTAYLVTAEQLAEGGYEPATSTRYFGLPAPLAPEAQERAENAILAMLD